LLLEALGQIEASVEHIGSTAVPGLAARDIIDIMIGLRDFVEADGLVPKIVTLGYTYVPDYEDVMPYRRFFRKIRGGVDTNHIHMVEIGKSFWQRHLLFRDYLRQNPEVVAKYAMLKEELAQQEWENSNDYAEAKTQFIKKVEQYVRRQKRADL